MYWKELRKNKTKIKLKKLKNDMKGSEEHEEGVWEEQKVKRGQKWSVIVEH